MKGKSFVMLLALLMLFAVVAFGACSGNGAVAPPVADETQEAVAIGVGPNTFRFEVSGPQGQISLWDVSTQEETVGAALLALELIAGDVSDWGLMVTCVNGITADFNENGAFWAFFVGGEFALQGADATYIEAGERYAFVYTQG